MAQTKTTTAQLTQVLITGNINPPGQGDNVPQSSLKHSTQISLQCASSFNKLLLNQPDFTMPVGDKKSGCTYSRAPRSLNQYRPRLPASHSRPYPPCRCSAILCHQQNALPLAHKLLCFPTHRGGCGLKTLSSHCSCREKTEEPEITQQQGAAFPGLTW